jgi:iron complex transport system substrate-binding protein
LGCVACQSDQVQNNAHLHTTKDDLHRTMQLPVRIERVMSLTPSITEILFKVVDSKKIVGRTSHCNFPVEAFKKPIVKSYPLDLEQLIRLKPQVIFVKDDMLATEDAQKIENTGIKVFFLKYTTCQDIVNSIVKVGKLMDEDYKSSLIADSMTVHLHQLKKQAALFAHKPKVLILIDADPIFVFGVNNFASDMLAYAGAINAVNDDIKHPYPQITREYLLQINPDIIIELGDNNNKSSNLLRLYPELNTVNAFKNNKLYSVEEDLVSRPGPRVISGILALKKMIHPDEK